MCFSSIPHSHTYGAQFACALSAILFSRPSSAATGLAAAATQHNWTEIMGTNLSVHCTYMTIKSCVAHLAHLCATGPASSIGISVSNTQNFSVMIGYCLSICVCECRLQLNSRMFKRKENPLNPFLQNVWGWSHTLQWMFLCVCLSDAVIVPSKRISKPKVSIVVVHSHRLTFGQLSHSVRTVVHMNGLNANVWLQLRTNDVNEQAMRQRKI